MGTPEDRVFLAGEPSGFGVPFNAGDAFGFGVAFEAGVAFDVGVAFEAGDALTRLLEAGEALGVAMGCTCVWRAARDLGKCAAVTVMMPPPCSGSLRFGPNRWLALGVYVIPHMILAFLAGDGKPSTTAYFSACSDCC